MIFSDDIIKIEYFNFDNVLFDEKSYVSILIDDISYKTLSGTKPLCITFDKVKGFIRAYDGTGDLVYFVLKRMMPLQ